MAFYQGKNEGNTEKFFKDELRDHSPIKTMAERENVFNTHIVLELNDNFPLLSQITTQRHKLEEIFILFIKQ